MCVYVCVEGGGHEETMEEEQSIRSDGLCQAATNRYSGRQERLGMIA